MRFEAAFFFGSFDFVELVTLTRSSVLWTNKERTNKTLDEQRKNKKKISNIISENLRVRMNH